MMKQVLLCFACITLAVIAQTITFTELKPGIVYNTYEEVPKKYFYRINPSNQTNNYFSIRMSSCVRYFDVYGKICNPLKTSCDVSDHIPTAFSNDFSYTYTAPTNDKLQSFPRQAPTVDLCGKGLCKTENIIFLSVFASPKYISEPVNNQTSPFSFTIEIADNANYQSQPSLLSSKTTLTYDAATAQVSWQKPYICSRYNFQTKTCEEDSELSVKNWAVYYYPFTNTNTGQNASKLNPLDFNSETPCGLVLNPLAKKIVLSPDTQVLSAVIPELKGQQKEYKYIINVVAEDRRIAYTAMVVTQDMIIPPEVPLGPIIGGLFATVAASGAIALVGAIIIYIIHKRNQSLM